MGKRCCYKSCCPPPCCPPCFPCCPPPCCPPPCCPPPCCPQPCNPCQWFAPGGDCCLDQCCGSSKKVDFLGQSNNALGPFTTNTTQTLTFAEVRDCGCDYNGDSTFNPKCKGTYTFCVSVPITVTSGTPTVTIQLKTGSGVIKQQATTTTSQTLNLNSTLCLDKCDSLFVNLVVEGEEPFSVTIPASNRTFSGYTSKCCKTYKSSCCC